MEFINLKKQYEILQPVIDARIKDVMLDARFIGGKEITEFEERLAAYVGRKYCITCASGTDALLLVCLAYDIGEGDAVFCPDMTFIASIEPACLLGATPVFCDIDSVSYNLSPEALETAIQKVKDEGKLIPKAVVAVDFLGNPADYEKITVICQNHNLILIEDAAQGIGGIYKGHKCGSLGDIACTSFFPSKPLGCYGDGGAVFTDSDKIARLLSSFKVHGKGSSKYDNVRIGTNSRLDTIQAAVLLSKMDVLEMEMEMRLKIAARYDDAFGDILQIPHVETDCRCAYAQYCLLAKDEVQRDYIVNSMKEAGIPSLLYYPKELHRMDAFDYDLKEEYTNATKYAKCNFGVPFSPYLTEKEQDLVIQTVKSALQKGIL
ncbi:MAG: DegT/DnrJ/EryC1/StrS family aminotransferase [Bacillus sp. (in: firmicutes)]